MGDLQKATGTESEPMDSLLSAMGKKEETMNKLSGKLFERRDRGNPKKAPETYWIQNLQHPAYQLSRPIPIMIENDINVVIATYDDIDLYGTGDDVQEAISDLCSAIVEYYEGLKENENRLGDIPTQEYAFLKQIIVKAQ